MMHVSEKNLSSIPSYYSGNSICLFLHTDERDNIFNNKSINIEDCKSFSRWNVRCAMVWVWYSDTTARKMSQVSTITEVWVLPVTASTVVEVVYRVNSALVKEKHSVKRALVIVDWKHFPCWLSSGKKGVLCFILFWRTLADTTFLQFLKNAHNTTFPKATIQHPPKYTQISRYFQVYFLPSQWHKFHAPLRAKRFCEHNVVV